MQVTNVEILNYNSLASCVCCGPSPSTDDRLHVVIDRCFKEWQIRVAMTAE